MASSNVDQAAKGAAKKKEGGTRRAVPLGDYWPLLRRYLAPQRNTALLMATLLLLSVGLQLVAPQIVRGFIDAARAGEPQGILVRAALLFLGITALHEATKVLATYLSERVAWTATNALRADLTEHLLRMDFGFFDTRTPGELIERVDGDVNALASFFSSFVVQLVGSSLLLTGVVTAFLLLNVWLGLAFALFALVALGALGWVRGFAVHHFHEDRQQSAAFYGYLGEVIAASEDIRSSGAVAYAMQRFFKHLREWLPVQRAAAVRGHTLWVAATLVFALGDALAYGLGGGLYRLGDLSLGAVYTVVAYTAMLASPIEMIRSQLQNLQQADASILRVSDLLRTTSKLAEGEQALPPGPLSVEFRGVSFSYQGEAPFGPQVSALEAVTFQLAPGRVLGVLGHTGSGKTTLARLLFHFHDPQRGEVRLSGVDTTQIKLASLRSRVGLVTQDVQLFEASLRDNITFFDPGIADEALLDVFGALGLTPWLGRLPNGLDTQISSQSLSAGEAQLLAFARVFIKNPGLIILDEASSRLDPATEALLERALDTLFRDRTAIIIAHRLETVERADEVLILEKGKVLEYGAREELAADPTSQFSRLKRLSLGQVLA